MSSEPTVEECLSELGPMFPDVEIQSITNARGTSWRIWLGMRGGNQYGATLPEAMAEVRNWHKEQAND
jgi:hypothetical protein